MAGRHRKVWRETDDGPGPSLVWSIMDNAWVTRDYWKLVNNPSPAGARRGHRKSAVKKQEISPEQEAWRAVGQMERGEL